MIPRAYGSTSISLPSAPPVAINPKGVDISNVIMLVWNVYFLFLLDVFQTSLKSKPSKILIVPFNEVTIRPMSLTYFRHVGSFSIYCGYK